jgi:ferredoxin--NADP+ reductase
MFKIARRESINDEVFVMEIEVPEIAAVARPGHHIDIRVNPDGTALTLPVAGYDREKGTVTIVHKAQDLPSLQLSMLQEGDDVFQVRGPLGGRCAFDDAGKVVLAAEDLGAASLYLRAKAYKDRGAYTICLLGFETKDAIFWEEEFASLCDELYVCTHDGSYGVNGRITNPLRAVCEAHKDIERIVMIGQLSKMKKAAKVAADYDIPATMSFDAIRRPVGSPNIFDVDETSQEIFEFAKAPEIDANEIDFEKLLAKQRAILKASENTATGA